MTMVIVGVGVVKKDNRLTILIAFLREQEQEY
jgi:hypothetical protein